MSEALFDLIAAHCFYQCGHVVRDYTPGAVHDLMEEHYRTSCSRSQRIGPAQTRAAKVRVGDLTHKHFGSVVTLPGHGPGVLWSVQHVGAVGDIEEPWTRLLFKPTRGGGSEGTKGLHPDTICKVETRVERT